MSDTKKYAYYIEGNKIAIIQETAGPGVCSLSGYNNKTTCEAAGGTWTGNAASRHDGEYTSPKATISDGLEIKYTYVPDFRINDESVTVTADSYDEDGNGLLKIVDTGNGLPTSNVTHIAISGSDKWNGVHKVNTLNAGYTILETKYSGASVTEEFTVYTDVSKMEDESFELDLPRYLNNAIVFYLKGKIFEDLGDFEKKEYYMREFKRQLEKHQGGKITTIHKIQGFWGMNTKF